MSIYFHKIDDLELISVVFIGQNIDQSLIKSTLDAVTLNDKEWTQWEKVRPRSRLTLIRQVMKSKKSNEKKLEKLYKSFDGQLRFSLLYLKLTGRWMGGMA